MTDQTASPRCGNNPNAQLTPGDRKAIDDFKARLALQADAKPYIEAAAWVDFDPLMEVIAATVWEHCGTDECATVTVDDPRTIAAFAAAVARAHAAGVAPATDQAAPACKFDEGCHRVVACDPGCGAPPAATDRAALVKRVAAALQEHGMVHLNDPDLADEYDCCAEVAIAAVLPSPADRAALRDRIAEALAEVTVGHKAFITVDVQAEYPRADAVLSVLPATTDRAAEIRAAAFNAAANYVRGHSADERYGKASISTALCAVSDELRRMAGETPQPETWTPPPPGDTREQLPDHLLELIRPYLPDYTSSACQTSRALADAIADRFSAGDRETVTELQTWRERMCQRCRTNQKFTGQLCGCHDDEQPAVVAQPAKEA